MKKQKNTTLETVQRYNGNTVERSKIVPLGTYIHDGLLSWVGTGNKKKE